MTEGNGTLRVEELEREVGEIKGSIAGALDQLTGAIDRNTTATDKLANKVEAFLLMRMDAIPLKAVFWIIALILVSLVGVEGIQHLFKAGLVP